MLDWVVGFASAAAVVWLLITIIKLLLPFISGDYGNY